MVQRRYRRRPWYRTRAYRLARTAVLVVVLTTMWSRCGSAGPGRAGGHTVAAAGADSGRADGREGSGTADPTPTGPPPPPPRPLTRSRPTSFRVPSLGIDAPIIPLRLDRDGQLETPPVDRPKLVGWYEGGPTPGEAGTAIAVGHRDTRTGPAVFAGLAQAKPGKTVEVGRVDGRTAVYSVDRVKVFDKLGFPDKEVYGATGRPELRVITCGGLFSRRTGYTSNVVVFAHLTATK
ncbi:class F sortase [Streptomyces sp. NPDC014636]|uniref:class F sortase n=1 Tax=Streptomyces sp. NPDC014636 TaxID=3364876 RepID=UPI0036F8C29D